MENSMITFSFSPLAGITGLMGLLGLCGIVVGMFRSSSKLSERIVKLETTLATELKHINVSIKTLFQKLDG